MNLGIGCKLPPGNLMACCIECLPNRSDRCDADDDPCSRPPDHPISRHHRVLHPARTGGYLFAASQDRSTIVAASDRAGMSRTERGARIAD
jgi:hypothetical protein